MRKVKLVGSKVRGGGAAGGVRALQAGGEIRKTDGQAVILRGRSSVEVNGRDKRIL